MSKMTPLKNSIIQLEVINNISNNGIDVKTDEDIEMLDIGINNLVKDICKEFSMMINSDHASMIHKVIRKNLIDTNGKSKDNLGRTTYGNMMDGNNIEYGYRIYASSLVKSIVNNRNILGNKLYSIINNITHLNLTVIKLIGEIETQVSVSSIHKIMKTVDNATMDSSGLSTLIGSYGSMDINYYIDKDILKDLITCVANGSSHKYLYNYINLMIVFHTHTKNMHITKFYELLKAYIIPTIDRSGHLLLVDESKLLGNEVVPRWYAHQAQANLLMNTVCIPVLLEAILEKHSDMNIPLITSNELSIMNKLDTSIVYINNYYASDLAKMILYKTAKRTSYSDSASRYLKDVKNSTDSYIDNNKMINMYIAEYGDVDNELMIKYEIIKELS